MGIPYVGDMFHALLLNSCSPLAKVSKGILKVSGFDCDSPVMQMCCESRNCVRPEPPMHAG